MLEREKLAQAKAYMQKTDIDLWITLCRETTMIKDPVQPLIGDMYFSRLAAIVVERDGKNHAIVSFLERDSAKQKGYFDDVISYDTTFDDAFSEYFGSGSKKKIALNFSKDDPSADGLTMGLYMAFNDLLKSLDYKGEVVSSSDILAEIRSVKCSEEIVKMKEAIRLTEQIFTDAKDFIKDGVTERQIFNFFQQRAEHYGTYPSWCKDQCPGVKVSLNSPTGHCGPTDIPAKKGNLVNVDFGVVYKGYCSDMQRMYYVLKDGEIDAPQHVKDAFCVVRDTIVVAKEFMKKGVTGFDTDAISREYLTGKGYKNWPHGLGHQVGLYVHDGGVSLTNKIASNPKRPMHNGYVFAVEPATYIDEGYICVEEMVNITDNGSEFLSDPQQELYLV